MVFCFIGKEFTNSDNTKYYNESKGKADKLVDDPWSPYFFIMKISPYMPVDAYNTSLRHYSPNKLLPKKMTSPKPKRNNPFAKALQPQPLPLYVADQFEHHIQLGLIFALILQGLFASLEAQSPCLFVFFFFLIGKIILLIFENKLQRLKEP